MVPQTIEELKQFCLDQGMPLEKMRFFIGENRFEPKCFGIYREGEQVIVYKNKDNGSRAVRYQGYDEAEACRILYAKIQDEINLRKNKMASNRPMTQQDKRKLLVFVLLFVAIIAFNIFINRNAHKNGYYRVDDDLYYCINDSFYYYDDGWYLYAGAYDGFDDYYYDDYDSDYYYDYYDDYVPFEDTDYYQDATTSSDNSDVYDSWDSSDTDWGSDW